tara:strand:+ start:1085 stop:1258 length:174 start_codon:yes stop_codon:yes gene_type:complete
MVTSLLTVQDGWNKRRALGGPRDFSYLVNLGHLIVFGFNFLPAPALEAKKTKWKKHH